MHVIEARNVNEALVEGLWWLEAAGIRQSSRNGPVIVSPEPVTTVYLRPRERVLFSEARNANPYFHLMEALWMLAGRDDAEWPSYFNANFKQYAEVNGVVHGAYGHRWRQAFGFDQLHVLVEHLRHAPDTRRAVLSMWAPRRDCLLLDTNSSGQNMPKDMPCNTHAYLDVKNGRLNLTVMCRSNDVIWGCYGANAVHFSILLEYLAAWGGWQVGTYRQVSYNYHAYTNIPGYPSIDPAEIGNDDRYTTNVVKPAPLVDGTGDAAVATWDEDLVRFIADPLRVADYRHSFFNTVAAPMYASWSERKSKMGDGAKACLQIKARDWRMACFDWIQRREEAKAAERS